MKRIFHVLLIALLIVLPVYSETSEDTVVLENVEIQKIEIPNTVEEVLAPDSSERTLKDKIHDIYNLEVTKYDKPSYLFDEILTKIQESGVKLVENTIVQNDEEIEELIKNSDIVFLGVTPAAFPTLLEKIKDKLEM